VSETADGHDPAAGRESWPWGLDDLPDPPERLWIAGAPPPGPWVAIVGSRAASPYGLAIAHRIAGDLARLGIAVVSGLARGIDAAAHRGALAAGGPTIAVLPSGLDCITPPAHEPLAREIARGGALLTEIASGGPRYRSEFLHRNRLIAATARATVVVEAAESSGALSTAAVARRLGRPVLAVPGDVDRPTSRGANALLRAGAQVCEGAADVLAALQAPAGPRTAVGHTPATSQKRRAPRRGTAPVASAGLGFADSPASASDEARVAAALGVHALTLDAIAAASALDAARTLAALTRLEWSGVACARPGARWSRR